MLCDPTGSVCPFPGSGCSKNDVNCPALLPDCHPSLSAPDDPSNCAYLWINFDFWTKIYNAHSVDWMYDAYYTPSYLSVRGTRCTGPGQASFGADPTCVAAANVCNGDQDGGCDPPYDIDKTPGSGLADGTNQNYKWFVTALNKHLQATGEHITYWETWNEPNICGQWNHNDQSDVDCTLAPGGAPSTGTIAHLVRMAQDARSILPSTVRITTPPVTDVAAINKYLAPILAKNSTVFDVVGFHGYFNTHTGCPDACPSPEAFVPEWSALRAVMSNAGVSSKPAFNTEFSWGANSNVTMPDMRAAFAARTYLLQESVYPALARVQWYGEDFPMNLDPNSVNGGLPSGGTGQFWSSSETSDCTVPDPVQGGFDCPAGLAMKRVSKWTIGATFDGPCACSASPNGGSCSDSPPTGIFQCTATLSTGKKSLFVWDNTATTFPCTNAACGSTSFTTPSGFTADWQDLDGNTTSLGAATTVTVGAKPVRIDN
jgi:hypothetical protein